MLCIRLLLGARAAKCAGINTEARLSLSLPLGGHLYEWQLTRVQLCLAYLFSFNDKLGICRILQGIAPNCDAKMAKFQT